MKPAFDPNRERAVVLWALRLVILGLPVTAGSYSFNKPAALLASFLWALLVFAAFYRHPLGLVAVRTIPASGLILALAAAEWLTAAHFLALTALAFTNTIGTAMVNGPAYPNEHRELLRVPAGILLGPLQICWLAVVLPIAGLGAAVQSERWMFAGVCGTVLAVLAPFAIRSLHALARRWVVFVPAGIVVHDAMMLADPVLFQRELVERLQPAPADTDALDLTMGSWGLALELSLHEKVPMVLRKDLEFGSSARLIVTPSRAGAVLTEARQRSIGSAKSRAQPQS